MKRLTMLLLATLSVATSNVGDWEDTYLALNNCGNPIEVYHVKGEVGLIDGNSSFVGKSLSLHGLEINGCVYHVSLDSDVSQPEFESQMNKSGFQIKEKKQVTIQPILAN